MEEKSQFNKKFISFDSNIKIEHIRVKIPKLNLSNNKSQESAFSQFRKLTNQKNISEEI